MFVKITTSGPRRYVKLVEAYRDAGGVSRQRVIATLGRIEAVRAGEADSLVNGLRCMSRYLSPEFMLPMAYFWPYWLPPPRRHPVPG